LWIEIEFGDADGEGGVDSVNRSAASAGLGYNFSYC
jgi:hypothetical protein